MIIQTLERRRTIGLIHHFWSLLLQEDEINIDIINCINTDSQNGNHYTNKKDVNRQFKLSTIGHIFFSASMIPIFLQRSGRSFQSIHKNGRVKYECTAQNIGYKNKMKDFTPIH